MSFGRITIAFLAATVLLAGACGDDDTDDEVTAETAADMEDRAPSTSTGAGTTGDGDTADADPCELLDSAAFADALDASAGDPEDVSEAFPLAGAAGSEARSRACQWQVSPEGQPNVSYSVELALLAGPEAGDVYDAELAVAERFQSADETLVSLSLPAQRATGLLTDGQPQVLAHDGDLVVRLSTASDDLTVEDLVPLAESVLERLDATG